MTYTLFNVVFGLFSLAVLALLARREWRVVVRVSTVLVLFSFPWDYFAIHIGAWRHPAPGITIYGVPVNDMVFILSATLVTTSILIVAGRTSGDPERVANSEHAEEDTG